MLSSSEVGMITFRLAIADELFLQIFMVAARLAGERMLPEDADKIEKWSHLVRALRGAFDAAPAEE